MFCSYEISLEESTACFPFRGFVSASCFTTKDWLLAQRRGSVTVADVQGVLSEREASKRPRKDTSDLFFFFFVSFRTISVVSSFVVFVGCFQCFLVSFFVSLFFDARETAQIVMTAQRCTSRITAKVWDLSISGVPFQWNNLVFDTRRLRQKFSDLLFPSNLWLLKPRCCNILSSHHPIILCGVMVFLCFACSSLSSLSLLSNGSGGWVTGNRGSELRRVEQASHLRSAKNESHFFAIFAYNLHKLCMSRSLLIYYIVIYLWCCSCSWNRFISFLFLSGYRNFHVHVAGQAWGGTQSVKDIDPWSGEAVRLLEWWSMRENIHACMTCDGAPCRSDCWFSATILAPKLLMVVEHMPSEW